MTKSSATAPDLRSRLRGCLLAGAAGDALGAAVEFWTLEQIHARLGPDGVTGYAFMARYPGY